jgi:hypothetical protein
MKRRRKETVKSIETLSITEVYFRLYVTFVVILIIYHDTKYHGHDSMGYKIV